MIPILAKRLTKKIINPPDFFCHESGSSSSNIDEEYIIEINRKHLEGANTTTSLSEFDDNFKITLHFKKLVEHGEKIHHLLTGPLSSSSSYNEPFKEEMLVTIS